MTQTNRFPAILIAGAPNCGKSVLAYLLTHKLRADGVAHYLLRAAPDGEGDWFQAGSPDLVRQIRAEHKRPYSPELVDHMCAAIHNRTLPLLVDVGGKPRADQLEILRACTHSILLYRTPAEKAEWRSLLAKMNLRPIAELRSDLNGQDEIMPGEGVFQATISGLDRDERQRRAGLAFENLAQSVSAVCAVDAATIEAEHIRRAPFPVVLERNLAEAVGVRSNGQQVVWQPSDLARINRIVQSGQPMALYGRGPVWLAAALAALALPAQMALFDARYGWLTLAEVGTQPDDRIQFDLRPYSPETGVNAGWLEIRLAESTLEPESAALPGLLKEGDGLVLSGKLPRWYFAALAQHLAAARPWLALYVPALNQAVVIASQTAQFPLGAILPTKIAR